jgi:hypothetical protein
MPKHIDKEKKTIHLTRKKKFKHEKDQSCGHK